MFAIDNSKNHVKWNYVFQTHYYRIHYWRAADGREVDFVLYGERGIKAFEVKRAAKPTSSELGGLRAFLKDYPMARAFLLYGGSRRRREGAVECVPLQEALPIYWNCFESAINWA